MKANIYLKIAGLLFLAIGTMELLEQRRNAKKNEAKADNENAEPSIEMRIPNFRKLEPLIRVGQA